MTKSKTDKADDFADDASFLRQVELAARELRTVLEPTPLQRNAFLSDRYKGEIYLKREDLSPVRSYKLRGAFNFFRKALAQDATMQRFICASAGNHAQGFAYACQHFGVAGVVYMPVTTPQQKINKTRVFGGDTIEIKLIGDIFDESYQAAFNEARDTGALMVPPFDHPDIVEGQASVALELLQQAPCPIDLAIIPVGGGGLAAGVTRIMRELSPRTKILYVEPAGAPSFKTSLEAGKRVKLERIDSFVDGAAVAQIGAYNFELLKHVDPNSVQLIPENRLCQTIIEMLNIEGIVLEPAGALEIDALRSLAPSQIEGKTIACITSGGNFDFERLPEVKERALKAAGLKKYYILRLPQRPGALREFLDMLGPDDDIARFEYLKKSARNFGSILVGVESKSPDNFDVIVKKMTDAGLQYQDITDDELVAAFII